jgi:hypothetical protein
MIKDDFDESRDVCGTPTGLRGGWQRAGAPAASADTPALRSSPFAKSWWWVDRQRVGTRAGRPAQGKSAPCSDSLRKESHGKVESYSTECRRTGRTFDRRYSLFPVEGSYVSTGTARPIALGKGQVGSDETASVCPVNSKGRWVGPGFARLCPIYRRHPFLAGTTRGKEKSS